MNRLAGYALVLAASVLAQAQTSVPTAADRLGKTFVYINEKLLAMAKDFPEAKYDFKLKPEMRSFGDVIVHVASGNMDAAKAGRGQKVKWDEIDPKSYKGKAAIVALLEQSIQGANASLKQNPEGWQKSLDPFLSVLQHSSEHYGLLVAYYRANGIVPPDSRPKK